MSCFTLVGQQVCLTATLDREVLTANWWDMLSAAEKSALGASAQVDFVFPAEARVDSAGLAWILNALRDAKQVGLEVNLQNIPPKLLKLAKISDVDVLLPSY